VSANGEVKLEVKSAVKVINEADFQGQRGV